MSANDSMPDLLTEREAAELLGISRRRMEYLKATGRVAFYDMRPPRYDRKDLEEFREREAKSAAELARWKIEYELRVAEKRARRQCRKSR